MVNSQIQEGTSGLTQILRPSTFNLDEVRSLVEDLQLSMSRFDLGVNEREELSQEVATLKAQLQSPKPKSTIIRESLRSIRNILEGATGSAFVTETMTRLGVLLGV